MATAFQQTQDNQASSISYIRDGIAGNYDVVFKMIRVIRDTVFLDIGLQNFAAELLIENDLNAHSPAVDIFKCIYNFVADRVVYISDPHGRIETIKDARTTIDDKYGDCDDQTILIASLLAALGYEPKIALARYTDSADGNFQHVYCVVYANGERFVLDPTLPDAAFNKEHPPTDIQEISVFDFTQGVDDLQGIFNGVKDLVRGTKENAVTAASALSGFLPVGIVPAHLLSVGAAMLGKVGAGTDSTPESLSALGSRVNGRLRDIIIDLQNGRIAVEVAKQQAKQASGEFFWIKADAINADVHKHITEQIESKLNYIENYGRVDAGAVLLNTQAMTYLGIAAVGVILLIAFKK